MGLGSCARPRALLAVGAALCALLCAPPAAPADDVISLLAPRDQARHFVGSGPVTFRFTALTQSSTELPKIQVSSTGLRNPDGTFVANDVIETTTARRVAGTTNTFQVQSSEGWTRRPGTYFWYALTFYCGDPYNCNVYSGVRQISVLPHAPTVLFHSVTVRRVRRTWVAWIWLGTRSTVGGVLVRELRHGRELTVRRIGRRTLPAGRRPIRLGVLDPARYALYLTARAGPRHREIRRLFAVKPR